MSKISNPDCVFHNNNECYHCGRRVWMDAPGALKVDVQFAEDSVFYKDHPAHTNCYKKADLIEYQTYIITYES